MSQKQKNEKLNMVKDQARHLKEVALHPHFHLSLAFMMGATALSLYSHSVKQSIVALQTANAVYVPVEAHGSHDVEHRRENEVHPRHRGHSVEQRTPPVSGSL